MARMLGRALPLATLVSVLGFGAAGSARPAGSIRSARVADTITWKLVHAQCSADQLPAGEGCFDKPADGTGAWTAGPQSATWTYPDASGSQWTVDYRYPVPDQVPAAGVKMTLSVTAMDPPSGPGNGIDAQVCIGSLSTFTVQEANNCASAYAMHPGDTKEGHADVTLTPPNGGVGSHAFLVIDMGGGHQVHFTYEAKGTQPPPPNTDCSRVRLGGDPVARDAAINEVHVVAVKPDMQFHKGGTPADAWLPLEKDTILKAGDEISADPDGEATLAFADNSTVTVSGTTQLKIGSFFTEGGVVRTEILLKMGQVAACVNKSEATKSDFRIKSPTAVSSVRGTIFTMFYDPGSGASLVSTSRGLVQVTPANSRLRPVTVGVGREVEVTRTSKSPVTRIGKAGARGGVDILHARALVLAAVAKHNRACKASTPRTGAFAVLPARGGWVVKVRLIGGLKGTSVWSVTGGRAAPVNGLAKSLQRSCR